MYLILIKKYFINNKMLAWIIFAVLVGIFILIANVYLSDGYGAVTAISQIIPKETLTTGATNPPRSAAMDQVLELNKISPVYDARPEFSDIRRGIVEPNKPIPVPTSVTV